jgi:uncharacterized protein YjiS (DUF1127 family)
MTALDHATHVIDAPSRAVTTVERVYSGLRSIYRALVNRQQLTVLNHMSDRELADIGLMREDVDVAMKAPFTVDPTRKLGQIAYERSRIMSAAREIC